MKTKQVFISSIVFLTIGLILSSCLPKVNNNNIASSLEKTNVSLTKDASSLTTPTIPCQKTIGITENKVLTKNQNCSSSCFYGIEPSITTISKAEEIFNNLGSPIRMTYQTEQYMYYYASLQNKEGLYITVIFKTEKDIIQSINVTTSPDEMNKKISDQMFVFYKDIFSVFGQPNDIRISINYPTEPMELKNEIGYSLFIFYTTENLIIEYAYQAAIENNSILLCPLIDKFQGAWLWLGKNPDYAPLVETKLVNVSDLSIQHFYNIYSNNNSESSCFLVSP